MDGRILVSAGLLVDILGAWMVWWFVVEPEGHGLMLESYDAQAAARTRRRNRILSQIGFVLLMAGFAVQLVGNWLPDS